MRDGESAESALRRARRTRRRLPRARRYTGAALRFPGERASGGISLIEELLVVWVEDGSVDVPVCLGALPGAGSGLIVPVADPS